MGSWEVTAVRERCGEVKGCFHNGGNWEDREEEAK